MKQNKPIKTITIDSFSAYIQLIEEKFGNARVLFRGQRENSNAHYDLLPKIARNRPTNILSIEKKLFDDFKKNAIPYLERNIPKNDWEWLTLAQHHGLPTRLLDWTTNPLAALWFIVNRPPKSYKSYGIIWVFRPDDSDFVDVLKGKNPFRIKKTKVLEPTHIARRITAQAACFTVHKYLDQKSKFLPLNKNIDYKHKLLKVKVHGDKYEKIRNQLDRCGINSVTLFADLDSLCKHIAWKNFSI